MSFTPSSPSSPLGLAGATAATRYVGGTVSGAPLSGTFAAGDFVIAQNGGAWVCTVAGSPGTWVDVATIGPTVASVFGRTGAVVAATNDYNYAQIAASANAVAVSNLVGGLAGQVLGGTGPSYAYPPGYEFGYTAQTSDVSITHTTEATADTIATAPAFTGDGVTSIYIEVWCCNYLSGAGGQITQAIYDGASSIGFIGFQNIGAGLFVPGSVQRIKLTPSAASHTYSWRAFVNSGTGTIKAGPGGIGANYPAYIRVVKA